jgi:hypothetical protein
MMKRILTILVCAIFSGMTLASGASKGSGNVLAEKGYVANVGVSVFGGLGIGADLFTSHGYSFGNGLWVGGGTGLSFPSPYDLFLPFYSEVKYTFLADRNASPFVSARVGGMTNFDECRMILNPAVGVDIKRFTVFATMNLGLVSMRTFGLGFCWNFR